ncbi:hypothetical protein PUN28_002792 [Cardiocondyla obscurior]|uniref:Uncharacterized protein n=1 Tax=Cardiocondyla obscurior TaxID=286306 RepID=A0AAW2GWC8_9HYME
MRTLKDLRVIPRSYHNVTWRPGNKLRICPRVFFFPVFSFLSGTKREGKKRSTWRKRHGERERKKRGAARLELVLVTLNVHFHFWINDHAHLRKSSPAGPRRRGRDRVVNRRHSIYTRGYLWWLDTLSNINNIRGETRLHGVRASGSLFVRKPRRRTSRIRTKSNNLAKLMDVIIDNANEVDQCLRRNQKSSAYSVMLINTPV